MFQVLLVMIYKFVFSVSFSFLKKHLKRLFVDISDKILCFLEFYLSVIISKKRNVRETLRFIFIYGLSNL